MLDDDSRVRERPDGHLRVRIVAALAAFFWGFLFFGVIDLLAFAAGEEFHATLVLGTGWGLVFLFLVAVPLGAVAGWRRATAPVARAQVALVAVAVVAGAALSASARHFVLAAALGVTVAVLLALDRGSATGVLQTWRWSRAPGALVIVAVGPACAYAWTAARSAGSGGVTDDTWSLDHWPVQAALPLALLAIAALASGHPRGWRLPAWCVAMAAGWFAVVCWLQPNLAGSVGRTWSTALFVWALAFIAATSRTASR